jgi:regulator of protease activity HflC (stomatin/prohibitin superfamily)
MSTSSVQGFIRAIIFLFVFGILSLFWLVLLFTLGVSDAIPVVMVVAFIINSFIASIISKMFFVLPEWERLVLLRLGKYTGTKGPGVFIVPPFIYSVAAIVDNRITTHQVEATATLTKDNVPTRVTAAIEMQIENAELATMKVQNYFKSVTWLATEALKNTIGSLDLKELLSNRDQIAEQLKIQIDEEAAVYGINVRAVRITDIDTPPELIEELAVIARARRASQAKQIQAEAEILVAQKVAEATEILNKTQGGFKLREMQNLAEIAKENSNMIIAYPYDSEGGKEIAFSAAGAQHVIKK